MAQGTLQLYPTPIQGGWAAIVVAFLHPKEAWTRPLGVPFRILIHYHALTASLLQHDTWHKQFPHNFSRRGELKKKKGAEDRICST